MPTLAERAKAVGVRAGLVWAGLAAAFVLSVLLHFGICTDACKPTYNWTIFGLKFPVLGIGFFGLCLLLFSFRGRPAARSIFPVLIAGAWGAEITFLHVQHAIIKRWCPMCLAEAFCVCVVGIALAAGHISGMRRQSRSGRGAMVRQISKGVFLAAVIDCYPTYTPQYTLMKLEYPTTDPDLRTLSVTATAGSITAGEVEEFDARAAVIGSSLRGEVGMDVICKLREKDMLVAADMQGFVRVLRGVELKYEPWEEMQSTLALVDVVKSDAVEAEYLTGETDIYRAAKSYTQMGPREIVLTHKDGLLIHANGKFYDIAFHSSRLDARSGRGDTCIGTYVAKLLSLGAREAGVWAAAVTSLKMENLGPFNRSIDEVETLIWSKYNHGSIR